MSAKASAAQFSAVYAKAVAAGMAAGNGAKPVAMIVGSPSTFLGSDLDPTKPQYLVEDGVCGFAWVTVSPGNSSFAKWLSKNVGARKGYYGGVEVSVRAFGQSMQRKEACAAAMAETFRAELGVKAYANSRMD